MARSAAENRRRCGNVAAEHPLSATFRPGRALTLQVAAALVTVVALASWQFSRALEKTALRDARLQRLVAEPIAAAEYTRETADFTRLSLVGRYDAERQFFVADRPGGGVQVVAPFVTASGVFLVNRGWLSPSGREQPAVATPAGAVSLVGVVWPTKPVVPMLAKASWPEGWPKQVRGLQPARMATAIETANAAYGVEVRLEADNPGSLRAASLAWDYSPGTHWGYVAQWLLIGVAIAIGYVAIGKRRARGQLGDG